MAAGLAGSHACWPKFVYCRGHGLVGNSSGQEPRYRGRGDEASEPASDGCPPGSPSLLPLRALRSFARLPLLRPTATLGLSPKRAPCSGALAQHPRPARPYHFLHRLRPSMTLAPPPLRRSLPRLPGAVATGACGIQHGTKKLLEAGTRNGRLLLWTGVPAWLGESVIWRAPSPSCQQAWVWSW